MKYPRISTLGLRVLVDISMENASSTSARHRIIGKVKRDYYAVHHYSHVHPLTLTLFWLHNANQVPPSSTFVIWMIGWSGSASERVGYLILH